MESDPARPHLLLILRLAPAARSAPFLAQDPTCLLRGETGVPVDSPIEYEACCAQLGSAYSLSRLPLIVLEHRMKGLESRVGAVYGIQGELAVGVAVRIDRKTQ